jgi:hypothetical protein
MSMQESMCQSGRRSFLWRLAVGFSALTGCSRSSPLPPHLFACEERDLRAIAHRAAPGKIDPDQIQRNSTGSQVYLSQGYSSELLVVVSSVGRPTILERPALVWAIADDLTFVAWSNDLKTGLEFRTGFHQELPKFAGVHFTPGSGYYFIADQDHTTVYATDNPGVPLARANFTAQRIFCKKDGLYLFGFDPRSQEWKEIIGRVFRITGGAMTREADFHIPRPFAAASPFSPVDLDNWSDHLLCIDIRDEFGAKWFLYDLHSKTLTDLGEAYTYGLFLQDDRLAA